MVFMLLFSSAVFAADKLAWTIDTKKMNLPKTMVVTKEAVIDPGYKIQFTPDNKVLVSFWERRPQTELTSKNTPEKSGTVFVVLLLAIENGELIKRIEWPVLGESLPGQQIGYGSRIYPLPSGGYVGIINRHLQVLDSSFNVIHDRALERNVNIGYGLITPLRGQCFIIEIRGNDSLSAEIIDSKTFKTIEQINLEWTSTVRMIKDIWENRLLATIYHRDINKRFFFEKKIGDSQWNDFGWAYEFFSNANFIYNGTIIVAGYVEPSPDSKGVWVAIDGGKRSDPVFDVIGGFSPSSNAQIVANKSSHMSDFRRALDLNNSHSIRVYDLDSHRILFETKKYSDLLDYAISPNGDSIVLMTKKKIELYKVPAPGAKK